jgi:hypothetical protein
MAIKIEGLDKVLADFRKFGDDGVRSVKKNIEFSATNIESKAISRAPGPPFNIKQRINKDFKEQGLTAFVGYEAKQGDIVPTDTKAYELAAFVEFGTGLSAVEILSRPGYTKEIRDLAYTFKKEKDGYLVGTPYLFPSFFEEIPELIKRLERDLKNLAGKV